MASSPGKPQPEQCNFSSPEKSQSKSKLGSVCPGMKLVIDNIDSTIKPRYQRVDSQNKSLHMCKYTL